MLLLDEQAVVGTDSEAVVRAPVSGFDLNLEGRAKVLQAYKLFPEAYHQKLHFDVKAASQTYVEREEGTV